MTSVAQNLENQLLEYVQKNKISKVILGLSGGVDSAVTFAIAVEALGKGNIIPVLMPYKLGVFSSHKNYEDALVLCSTYEVPAQVFELDQHALPFEGHFNRMAFGNTLARLRMTLLFGIANQENGIVLGTCNKNEIMLGYETKFGDGACDISVIGDLWKSEVYELAKHYSLPESFIEKSPSAELYAGQTDEIEMGFSYGESQAILLKIEQEEKDFSPQNALEKKVFDLYSISEHKRKMPPLCTKNS